MTIESVIADVIRAVHLGVDYDPFGRVEPSYDFSLPLDPVARITSSPTRQEPIIEPLEQPQPRVDVMTTTPRERTRAERTYRQMTPGSSGAFQAAQAATGLRKPTNNEFVRKLLAKEGAEYEWGGTTRRTGFDCSGLIYSVMRKMGFGNFPRHSSAIYEHSKKISVKQAIKTRGAILYHPGHIAISLGNGKTIEAMGEAYGVVIGNARGRFSGGGILPELQMQKVVKAAKKGNVRRVRQIISQAEPQESEVTVSSLISAPTVFGSLMGEIQNPPRTRREFEQNAKTGGLGFVPARYRDLFRKASERYGLPARLLATVAKHESGFNPKAVSSAGAQGLMQVMPLHGLENPFNPRENVFAGARILASYIERMGSVRDGLAAYNAGPNNHTAGFGYADMILASLRGKAA